MQTVMSGEAAQGYSASVDICRDGHANMLRQCSPGLLLCERCAICRDLGQALSLPSLQSISGRVTQFQGQDLLRHAGTWIFEVLNRWASSDQHKAPHVLLQEQLVRVTGHRWSAPGT